MNPKNDLTQSLDHGNPYQAAELAHTAKESNSEAKPVSTGRKVFVSIVFGALTLLTALITTLIHMGKSAPYILGAVTVSVTVVPLLGMAIFAILKKYRNFFSMMKVAAWSQAISVFLALSQLADTATKGQ